MKVRKILYPTDFSNASQPALRHAMELCRRFDAELLLTHVRTPFSDDPNRPEYHFIDEGRYSAFIQAELDKASDGLAEDLRVSTVIGRDVSPANGILRVASEQNIDMIAMGTHGRSGLGHFFLGSVAERVVRYAKVPVLTVASKRDGYRDRPVYSKILATYDFSVHSNEAVRRARELADKYGSQLLVLYVIEQEIHPGYYEVWKVSVRNEMPEIQREARRALEKVLGEVSVEDAEIHVEIGEGDGRIHRDIKRFVRAHEIDLIVMGTYGLSGIEHMLLGSTTERVLRIASCPVMTFHLQR
jgi:nucleotide-binding universal stress UspA family protein